MSIETFWEEMHKQAKHIEELIEKIYTWYFTPHSEIEHTEIKYSFFPGEECALALKKRYLLLIQLWETPLMPPCAFFGEASSGELKFQWGKQEGCILCSVWICFGVQWEIQRIWAHWKWVILLSCANFLTSLTVFTLCLQPTHPIQIDHRLKIGRAS